MYFGQVIYTFSLVQFYNLAVSQLDLMPLNRHPAAEPHEQPPRAVLRAAAQREGGRQQEDPQPVQDPGEVGQAERGHLGGAGQRAAAAAGGEAEEQSGEGQVVVIGVIFVVSPSSW